MAQNNKDVIEGLVGSVKRTSKALGDPSKREGLRLAKEQAKKSAKSNLKRLLEGLFGGAKKE